MDAMPLANQTMGKFRCWLCPREEIVDIDHAVLCLQDLDSITGRHSCAWAGESCKYREIEYLHVLCRYVSVCSDEFVDMMLRLA